MVSSDLCRRILAQCLKDLLNLLKSFDTFQGDGFDIIFVVAVALIHIQHCIPERLALCFIESCCFSEGHGCNNSIFISRVGTDQAAVALLKSKQVCTLTALFKAKDLLSDILKSSQHLDQACPIIFCNGICHICGNDGLDQNAVIRKSFYCFCLSDLIICKKAAGHISCQCMVFSGLGIFYVNTKAVCIRVCGKDQVCIYFFCKLQAQSESFCCLRVRIAYSREVTVRELLLFYYIDMLKSQLF